MTEESSTRLNSGHKRDIIVALIGVVPGVLGTLVTLFATGVLGNEENNTSQDLADANQRIVSLEREIEDLQSRSNHHPFIGGIWINSQGQPKFLTQSGARGESIVITEGSTIYSAQFESGLKIRATPTNEVLYGEVSADGKVLNWTHGRPWTRHRSPRMACNRV